MNKNLVLVDTSAWIEFLKTGAQKAPVAREVSHLIEDDRIVTTEPVFLELSAGARDKKDLKELKEMFSLFHLAQVKDRVWIEASDNVYLLKRKGLTVPTIDLIIATVAITYDLPLLHRDKHFQQMAKELPLKIYES